jgi:hypothetical protein
VKRLTGHVRSNAIAYVALFIALSGSAYAATSLPANSVGTKQLKNNAVTGPKVKNGSLLKVDFKSGQLLPGAKGDKGDSGPQGLQGLQGLQGEKGDKGDPGSGGGTPITLNEGDDAAQLKPPASPNVTTSRDTVFTTTVPTSTVIVNGFAQADFACPAGSSCQYSGGLYLDDSPVPGTLFSPLPVSQNSTDLNKTVPIAGRIPNVVPGTHHLRLAFKQTSGNPLTVTVDGGSGSVLVVPQP